MAADAAYAPLEEPEPLYAEDVPSGPAYFTENPARRIERAPEGLIQVARGLAAISDAPEYFFEDPIVYLGLRETLHRLRRQRDQDALGDLEGDLWQIALRAELGSLADAEAALRAAERALMEALARALMKPNSQPCSRPTRRPCRTIWQRWPAKPPKKVISRKAARDRA